MHRIIILTTLLVLTLQSCSPQCNTCQSQNNQYSCLSCKSTQPNLYFFSCQSDSNNEVVFILVTVLVVLVYLFMLGMGLGVYRDLYENLQLVVLVSWRYGFGGGVVEMQGTNFAAVQDNSFPDTFGYQFIAVMILLAVFWLLLLLVDKISHNATAILIRRKKIIFPTRLFTLIFNILFYSSIMQIATSSTQQNDVFALALAILALIKIGIVLCGLGITSNWKYFQVDDPAYYVLVEQLVNRRWYARNNVLASLLVRGGIIVAFVASFKEPGFAFLPIVILQALYILYILFCLRYKKTRYFILILLSNILAIITLIFSCVGALHTVDSSEWNDLSTLYMVFVILMAVLCLFSNTSEMFIQRAIILKQLRSFYDRFVCCNRIDDDVQKNKYDEGGDRQKVKEFKKNLLYKKQIKDVELSYTTSKNAMAEREVSLDSSLRKSTQQ